MSSSSSVSGGLNIGRERGQVRNKKTYIGENAGRQAGLLDQILGLYAGGQQQAQAENDLLFGGPGYGSAGRYYSWNDPANLGGGGPGDGEGADADARRPFSAAADNDFGGGGPGGGGGGGGGYGQPAQFGGDYEGSGVGSDTPFFDPDRSGQARPSGGLVGQYGDWESNPWQQGPNGDAETDVLGSYDWMASGNRNADEADIYGRLGELGGEWDQFGEKTGIDETRQGGYEGLSSQDPNELEAGQESIYGDLGQGGPSDLEGEQIGGFRTLGDRTGAEEDVYGRTRGYGSTVGEDVGTASDTYRGMVENPGYDEATKAALTRESMFATRNPFEQARDRVLRGAAARGNVGSTAGTEIQMANQEATALGNTAARNQIEQAREAIRQREAGASGLVGTQRAKDVRTEFGLSAEEAQNARMARQKQAGLEDLGGVSRDITGRRMGAAAGKGGLSRDITGRRMGAYGALGDVQAAQDARKARGLEGKQGTFAQRAAENTKQRDIALKGTQGKEGLFKEMFGRKQAGTAGKQHLYDVGQQRRAGDLAGAANLGTKTAEDYVESGGTTGSGGVSI
jgi:hypothetical protein